MTFGGHFGSHIENIKNAFKQLFYSKLELSEKLTIAPLQYLACSKRSECLRILSGNVILTSIKGHNALTNLRKMTANNHNVDLVSINSLY